MNEFWQSCVNRLEQEVPPQQMNAWIRPLVPLAYDESSSKLRVCAPNRFKLDWVRKNFGYIEDLDIRGGEPVLAPAPNVVIEVKLDTDDNGRSESTLADYELRSEVVRLMGQLDIVRDGWIQRIDVRFGVPRRALIERPIRGARR